MRPEPRTQAMMVAGFVERYRAALLAHCIGTTDSLDLVRTIDNGERRGE